MLYRAENENESTRSVPRWDSAGRGRSRHALALAAMPPSPGHRRIVVANGSASARNPANARRTTSHSGPGTSSPERRRGKSITRKVFAVGDGQNVVWAENGFADTRILA